MDRPIRPIVIAHRGASGYVPEHTQAAKALAYAMGADYLEQDVVATADDELVVLHDIHLDTVSDVAKRFPGRARADSRYYVRDFTLSELRTLQLHERTHLDGSAVYPGRFKSDGEQFRINTLQDELSFVATLRRNVGNPVGIYTEIKRPAWHREEGVDISKLCLRVLSDFGYTKRNHAVYLQCFDAAELRRIRRKLGCDLKLIQLIGENNWNESKTNYDFLRGQRGLQQLARTVDGIGPWITRLFRQRHNGRLSSTGLVARAHDVGLAVHPYTVRKDELPAGFRSVHHLMTFLIDDLAVDGLFCDQPEIAINMRKRA